MGQLQISVHDKKKKLLKSSSKRTKIHKNMITFYTVLKNLLDHI